LTVRKKAGLILLAFLCSLTFARGDVPDDFSTRNANPAKNPHDQEAECSRCHREGDRGKEHVDEDLCRDCHKLEKYLSKRFRHSLEEGCLSCHQNHSPKGKPLLKDDPIDLCIRCHDSVTQGRTHPMRVRDPNTGGELTCTSSCHDVHGTDFKFLCRLEPGRELCISCHQDLR
jgi:predicted CXXCH cytochrome family protein